MEEYYTLITIPKKYNNAEILQTMCNLISGYIDGARFDKKRDISLKSFMESDFLRGIVNLSYGIILWPEPECDDCIEITHDESEIKEVIRKEIKEDKVILDNSSKMTPYWISVNMKSGNLTHILIKMSYRDTECGSNGLIIKKTYTCLCACF